MRAQPKEVEGQQGTAQPSPSIARGYIKSFPYTHLFQPNGEKTVLEMLETKMKGGDRYPLRDSDGFFANDYPQNVAGLTHGRASTFGRLAGLNAAAEKA